MEKKSTRELIRDFQIAFERPVNTEVVGLSGTERELLGCLLLEETLEYVTKGLGLKLFVNADALKFDSFNSAVVCRRGEDHLHLELDEGQKYDPIESADGLGDVNVVAHFAAHWHGFNLDEVTEEINASNMSKLGADGKPIINSCLRDSDPTHDCGLSPEGCVLMDYTKPIGKILKGPNYRKPNVADVIYKLNK